MPRSGERPLAPTLVTPPRGLRVHVAGQLSVDGVDRTALGSRKARQFLRELALARGRPVPGDLLCDVLWGDELPGDPPAQIAVIASRLRRVLGADRITFSDRGYALHYDWLDVAAAESLVDNAERRLAQQRYTGALSAARSAVTLLAPATPGDRDAAMDRLVARSRHQYTRALLACGDLATALETAQRALDDDGWDEEALRLAMTAMASLGQTPAALQLYERFRQRVADELGAGPSAATDAVHRAVLRQEAVPDIVVRGARETTLEALEHLIGRDAEIRALDDALRVAAADRLARVTVEGEPGIGKTFLVTRWLDTLGPEITVLRARCEDSAGLLPLQPVLDALHAHLRDIGVDRADKLLAHDRAVLAPILGSTVAGSAPEVQPAMAAATPVAGEAMLYTALISLMTRVCETPAVLFIDSIEHADRATIAWLALLAQRAPQLRLAVVVTQQSITSRRVPADVVVSLQPLTLDDSAAIVGADRAGALHRRSGGNPLFLTELAAARSAGEVPPTIQESINARCDAVPEVTITLRSAAVLGATVDADLLARVLHGDPATVIDHLEQGARLAFLEERETVFAFRHAIVRDALAAAAGSVRRAFLHREAARLLADAPDVDPMQLADHARLSGERETAARALTRASVIAARRFDHTAALELVNEGLAQLETTEGLLQRARIRLAQARYSDAEADAERAVERGDDIRALEVAGAIAYYRRRFDHAQSLAAVLVQRTEEAPLRLGGLIVGARAAHAAGDLSAAAALFEEAAETAQRTGLPPPAAVHAFFLVHCGEAARALSVLRGADAAAETLSSVYTPVHRHFIGGYALATCGRASEALDRWRRGAAEAERFGLVRYLSLCNNMQSWVLRATGELAQARERNLEGRAGAQAADYRELEGYAILDLCETSLLEGRLDEAHAWLAEARGFAAEDYAHRWRQLLRIELLAARLQLAEGATGAAREAAGALAERAACTGAARYEVLAWLFAHIAAARAGDTPDPAEVVALCKRMAQVGGPDGWLVIAECAEATRFDACRTLAAEHAAALERALPEDLRPALRRYAGARLERMSTAGRIG